MYKGKIIFSQIMDFLPLYEFRICGNRYQETSQFAAFYTILQIFNVTAFVQFHNLKVVMSLALNTA